MHTLTLFLTQSAPEGQPAEAAPMLTLSFPGIQIIGQQDGSFRLTPQGDPIQLTQGQVGVQWEHRWEHQLDLGYGVYGGIPTSPLRLSSNTTLSSKQLERSRAPEPSPEPNPDPTPAAPPARVRKIRAE